MSNVALRKLILLSDGTGNSSIARDKSNVWRLYQALDIGENAAGEREQIAFYDDGVGTSGFRPLKLLGGAFGWGLSRNVEDLYRTLCRHYHQGDKIYIFGFSRGAYTARVLAHFIEICGIIDCEKHISQWPKPLTSEKSNRSLSLHGEQGFKRAVSKAYKSYRQSYWTHSKNFVPRVISKIGRFIRQKILRSDVPEPVDFKKNFCFQDDTSIDEKHKPPLIEFVGVWDTVDAVGLPIQQFTDWLDKFVYPYKFKDQKLSLAVGKAAQALAIDDERHTFSPLLWEQETDEDKARIQQVWFSGMHSDVGGGYPQDNLSYLPLVWMMDHLNDGPLGVSPLRFITEQVDYYRSQAQPTGQIHNSRRGVAVFYRYRPRNIKQLANALNPANHGTSLPINLHQSVLERIVQTHAGYAPAGIPAEYQICDMDQAIISPDTDDPHFETKTEKLHRSVNVNEASKYIKLGKVAYFSMLLVLGYVLLFPFAAKYIPWLKVNEWLSEYFSWFFDGVVKVSESQGVTIPSSWLDVYREQPEHLFIGVVVFGALYLWGAYLRRQVQSCAEKGWHHLKRRNPPEELQPDKGLKVVRSS
jgi:T6SS, Phospholipase effector Tle1-like, catalytic domain